jgi:tight adherence protein B
MSAVLTPLIYVLAFIAVVLLVQSTADMLFTARDKSTRVNRRLTLLHAGKSRDEVFASFVRASGPSRLDVLRLPKLIESVDRYCRQAGIAATPERLAFITLGIAGALWVLALAVAARGPLGVSLLLNAATSAVGALVLAVGGVYLWVRYMRARRLKRIEQQLPVALDIINRALRAGHPVVSAIQLASDEMSDPLGSELGLVVDETTYGVEFEQALINFAKRTGSEDAHFFAVSVSVQSDTGGNLAEILEGLAKVIRGRHTLSQRVKSLSSEGRASALVISAMPIFVIGVQLAVHPAVYSEKFDDPIFWPVVLVTALIYFGGWLIVRRIINFKY